MPVIKKQTQVLLPPGEYAGQARKVVSTWSKPKKNPDGSMSEPVQVFRIPLHVQTGGQITAFVRVQDSTMWVWNQLIKSADLVPPDDQEEFGVTSDDIEGRKFFFAVEHNIWNGAPIANVKFHTEAYAVQQNPALAGVTFPHEALRGIKLRPASFPDNGAAPSVTKTSPDPAVTPVFKEAEPPTGHEDLETLSEAEFADAMAYAKKLRKEKEGKH
jgi:hypothetical protein